MRTLYPPLTLIENERFAPSEPLIQRWRDGAALSDLAAALSRDPDAQVRGAVLDQVERLDFAPGDDHPVPCLLYTSRCV